MELTNFPINGEDKAVELRNSNYEQFDYEFASDLQKMHPSIWSRGGKKSGDSAFDKWTSVLKDDKSQASKEWIKERENYLNRNVKKEKLPSVLAIMKWGGVCEKGIVYMKELIRAEINKAKTIETNTGKGLTRKQLLEKRVKQALDNNEEMPMWKTTLDVSVKKFEDGSYRFIATRERYDADDEVVLVKGGDFKRYSKNPVFIWGHRMTEGSPYDVIGKTSDWKIEAIGGADGSLDALTFAPVYARHQVAQDVKQMHEDGIATAISIGFRVKTYDFETQSITEWELYEVSNVIVPSNEDAIAYAAKKGLITEDERKAAINEKLRPINKKKLSGYRDLFLGKDLLEALGYEVEGKEIKDMRNVYNLILEKLKTAKPEVVNQPKEEPVQQNEVKAITVGEASEYFQQRLSSMFGN